MLFWFWLIVCFLPCICPGHKLSVVFCAPGLEVVAGANCSWHTVAHIGQHLPSDFLSRGGVRLTSQLRKFFVATRLSTEVARETARSIVDISFRQNRLRRGFFFVDNSRRRLKNRRRKGFANFQ